MDEHLRKSIILEHYSNPLNKGLVDDDSYYKVNMNSESCIDNLDFQVKIKDDKIIDAKFDGEACAISTSASSILTDLMIGKTLEDALNIIKNYECMIEEKPYDKEVLHEALAYSEIYKQANRKKCAMLPSIAIKKMIEKEELNEK